MVIGEKCLQSYGVRDLKVRASQAATVPWPILAVQASQLKSGSNCGNCACCLLASEEASTLHVFAMDHMKFRELAVLSVRAVNPAVPSSSRSSSNRHQMSCHPWSP